MINRPINIAIIGLGFGAEFIPIYQRHPWANMAAICRRGQAGLDEVGDQYGIAKRYQDYDALLEDPEIDAVHINTPIPDHAGQALKALRAGKHVACTVPMATVLPATGPVAAAASSPGPPTRTRRRTGRTCRAAAPAAS